MINVCEYLLDCHVLDILSNESIPEHTISFISLKSRITELLFKALLNETDSANTQMLLGKSTII